MATNMRSLRPVGNLRRRVERASRGAKEGANEARCRTISSAVRRPLSQVNSAWSYVQRRRAMARWCLLSSTSRVRVEVGVLGASAGQQALSNLAVDAGIGEAHWSSVKLPRGAYGDSAARTLATLLSADALLG